MQEWNPWAYYYKQLGILFLLRHEQLRLKNIEVEKIISATKNRWNLEKKLKDIIQKKSVTIGNMRSLGDWLEWDREGIKAFIGEETCYLATNMTLKYH